MLSRSVVMAPEEEKSFLGSNSHHEYKQLLPPTKESGGFASHPTNASCVQCSASLSSPSLFLLPLDIPSLSSLLNPDALPIPPTSTSPLTSSPIRLHVETHIPAEDPALSLTNHWHAVRHPWLCFVLPPRCCPGSFAVLHGALRMLAVVGHAICTTSGKS